MRSSYQVDNERFCLPGCGPEHTTATLQECADVKTRAGEQTSDRLGHVDSLGKDLLVSQRVQPPFPERFDTPAPFLRLRFPVDTGGPWHQFGVLSGQRDRASEDERLTLAVLGERFDRIHRQVTAQS